MSSWSTFASHVKQRGQSSGQGKRSSPPLPLSSREGKEKEKRLATSSSFLGLKAELAERKGGPTTGAAHHGVDATDGFLQKSARKLPAHLRPSPDVLARSARHDQRQTTSAWANTPSSQLDSARRALERKAAMYNKLKRGATGGLDEQSLQESLIDWDRKGYEHEGASSGSRSGDDSDEGGRGSEGNGGATDSDDDPMTEYEDDLGRMRQVRRSRLPRSVLQSRQRAQEQEDADESMAVYGPSTNFPVYKPDPASQRLAGGVESAYKRKGADHFDSQFEKRYRGAGFYQFSQDEEARKKQMQALREDRDQTERAREGHQGSADEASLGQRRREERRKLVESKRREIEDKRRRLGR